MLKTLIVLAVTLFAVGCASKDYVRQQVEPLQDQISKCQACCDQAKKSISKSFELQQKK